MGYHFLLQGGLSYPGIEPVCLMSPALAGGSTSTPEEAHLACVPALKLVKCKHPKHGRESAEGGSQASQSAVMLVWWAQSRGHRPGRRVGHPLGWPEQWPLSAEAVSAMQCSDSALVSLQGEKTPDISQFWAQRAGAGEEGERHPVS